MNSVFKFLMILFLLNFPLNLESTEVPPLTVAFKIEKDRYRADFPSEIGQIEKECTKKIIETLKDYFAFLNFTEEPSPNNMFIILDDNEPNASSPMREVGFKISLSNSHILGQTKEVYWQFRPKEKYDRTCGTPDAFIKEVHSMFKKRLHEQFDLLTKRLFSKITITDQALSIRKHLTWVLPFKKADLGIEDYSQFNISIEFRDPLGRRNRNYTIQVIGEYDPENTNVPNLYRLGIRTEALEDQKYTDEIRGDDPMKVKGLFIIKYIPFFTLKPASSEDAVEEGR